MAAQLNYIPFARGSTIDQNVSGRMLTQTIDQFESRGFSGPAAAEKHKYFSASCVEA
jgi:hypothetical protein